MHLRNPSSSTPSTPLSRRTVLTGAVMGLGLGSLLPSGAQAQAVTRLIVPFPPGGPADFMGRLLSEKLRDVLGRTIVVDNRPGAGTRLAAELLKNTPADGNTVLLTPLDPMFIGPAIYSNLRFNPATDFKPITDVAGVQFGLAVNAASPVKTLAQFVQAAKANPDQSSIGISVLGSLPHFLAMDFVALTGSGSTLVPYRGGSAMATELLGNQVASAMDATTGFTEYHRAGKMRVLAVAGNKRADGLPDVPTFAEAGYPTLVASSCYALYAHANTAPAAIAQWNQAMRKVLAMPDVREKLGRVGYDLLPGSSPEEVVQYTNALATRWLPVIKASGFKGD